MRKLTVPDELYTFLARGFVLAAILIIPLVLHLKLIEVPKSVGRVFNDWVFEYDIFSWWKSRVLFVCATLSLTFIALKKEPWSDFISFKFRFPFLIYLIALVLSSVFSREGSVVWFGLPSYNEGAFAILGYLALFLVSTQVFRWEHELNLLWWTLYALTVILIFIGLTEILTKNFLDFDCVKWLIFGTNYQLYKIGINTYPLFTTLMNSNFLGTLCATLWPFFLVKSNRWSYPLSIGVLFLLIGSESRGALFAITVSSLLIWFSRQRISIKSTLVKGLSCLTVFGVLTVLISLSPHVPNLEGKLTFSSSGRTYIWEKSLKLIYDDAFFFGAGPALFALNFPEDPKGIVEAGWPQGTRVDRPHNFYFQVAHASGIISLIALVALFWQFLSHAWKRLAEPWLLALTASVISYLVNVCFTDSMVGTAPLFWVFFGAGVGLIEKKHKPSDLALEIGAILKRKAELKKPKFEKHFLMHR